METQKTSPCLIAFRILFTAALIGSIVFIFRNSLQVAAVSSDRSYQVMKIVNSVLARVNLGPLSQHVIRKLAHFCEYGVLGMILGALALLWKTPSAFFRGSYAFLLALATAVVDESIQLVADGRGAQVQDILLDAAGSLTGLLTVWLLAALLRLARSR